MENPEAEETKEFVAKQAALTESVLSRCEEREKLRDELTAVYNHPRFYIPFKRGGKYFYFRNTGLQAHNVLHVQVFNEMSERGYSFRVYRNVFADVGSLCFR